MSAASLVKMANDIGDYFASEPDHAAAVAAIATHIRRYWDPRMRRQIVAHLHGSGDGLSELARTAVARVAELDRANAVDTSTP